MGAVRWGVADLVEAAPVTGKIARAHDEQDGEREMRLAARVVGYFRSGSWCLALVFINVPRAGVEAASFQLELPLGTARWPFFSARGLLPLPLEHSISVRPR